MVMTRSDGPDRRKLVKMSSSAKGRIFDQEGSAMGPIDVEPIRSKPSLSLVPYDTSEDEVPTSEASRQKESSNIRNPNTNGLNTNNNAVQTLQETLVP